MQVYIVADDRGFIKGAHKTKKSAMAEAKSLAREGFVPIKDGFYGYESPDGENYYIVIPRFLEG